MAPGVNLCPCCPSPLEQSGGDGSAVGKSLFARISAAAHEKQNCSSGLTGFHINEAWSEDISWWGFGSR